MKTLSASEVRQNFQDVIDSVYYLEESIIVTRKGKPRVVISPLPKNDKKVGNAIATHKKIDKIMKTNK